MKVLLSLVANSLRLNVRNRMAMIYGYLFPLVFLLAFWTIYRHDRVPLLFHLGELLTVTALSGACFGLPTTMVSERERGVWRRYRLSPAPPWKFVAATLVTRYLLVLTGALLQMGVAALIGMPLPRHPLHLLFALTISSIAFMGIGLQIAMLAENVPAVQALGQCIFLPMLMVGGVAVPLASLPHWAVVIAAFLPGRYSVHAIQTAVTGDSLSSITFDLAALLLIGLAGAVAALAAFRWNPSSIPTSASKKGWLATALIAWIGVGLAAQHTGRITPTESREAEATIPSAVPQQAAKPAVPPPLEAKEETAASPTHPKSAGPAGLPPLSRWQDATPAYFETIAFDRLPPDAGLISPVAHSGEVSDPEDAAQLEQIRSGLAAWQPGKVADQVQRVRNDLYVAGVPDLLEIAPLERFVPLLVFSRLRADIPPADLPRVLYWIATHADEGEDTAISAVGQLGLPVPDGQRRAVRGRAMIYAMKLLGRETGAIGD